MKLDLTPAAAAAPRANRITSHARTEAMLLLRNGEQLILALVIPLGLLIGGRFFGDRLGFDQVAFPASVLGLALWSTSFTSLAISTGFERRYGVLERLVATPLTRFDLIAGKALAATAIALGQVVVLTVVAFAAGWRPTPTVGQSGVLLIGVPATVVTFAALALALGGRFRAEVTLGLGNLIYLLGAAGGALIIPVANNPAFLQPFVAALPTAALGEMLRAWATGTLTWWPLLVAAVWLVASLLVARKVFRWTS